MRLVVKRRRWLWAQMLLPVLALLATALSGASAQDSSSPETAGEEATETYYELVDEAGDVLTMTAMRLSLGDRYMSSQNREYEVVGFSGNRVLTELRGVVTLPDVSDIKVPGDPDQTSAASTTTSGLLSRPRELFPFLKAQGGQGQGTIAIYHTHSDESYIPASGKASEPKGDIYEVGKTMKETLERLGFTVVWSQANHNPHDGGAYKRSRRTVTQLMRERPVTMIDVHRDAVPPQVYQATVEGTPVTKVRLVVGRQNQNRESNLEYAKRIKALADREFPGLIEGIFRARGNYNQDIGPRMILVEVGAHTNSLERARQGAELFARIIPAAAGLTGGGANRNQSQAANRTTLLLLTLAAGAIVGFVLLNAELRDQVRQWFGGSRSDPEAGQDERESNGKDHE